MRASDITMTQSDDTTTLDFSAFSSMQENDYLELNINDVSIKLNVSNDMSINDFTEWITNNCNNNYDFYSLATASNNSALLNIVNKTSDQLSINYDFNR
ncbi:MAG: hypothetical protein Tp152DCM46671_31 [Prokaryotic dsDNA virus sp.]|nr:MAG: hypothetical protein Tp152DCM46671_31 [Prokaryotic dsDNA virus sp.]|tara:strand:- start:28395 stop:28691 length:297 start_codon:yes stop_codon:yes gene_type:complete